MQNKKWLAWALAVMVVVIGASVASNAAVRIPVAPVAFANSTPGSAAAPAASSSPQPSAPGTKVASPKLEMPPSAQPKSTTLPKSVRKAPVLSGTVPAEGTAKGKLTTGFPLKALPIPPGAHINDSSVSAQKRNLQVAVNYRTSLGIEAVLKFYESEAAKRGWVAARGTAADGAQSISLGFGKDTMAATVRTAPTGATIVAAFGAYEVGI